MATDGAVITVANGTVLAKPLHVVHVATRSSAATYTRSYLKLGNAAHATLVESFVAAGEAKSYQTNDAVIVWLGDDANLQHVRLMADSADAANITTAIFTLGAKARLDHLQHDERRWPQPISGLPDVCGRGRGGERQRRQPSQWPATRRHHLVPGSCGAELREPGNLPRGGRRSRPFGVSGPHHRSSRKRRRPTPR